MKKKVVFFGSDGISLPLLEFLRSSDFVEVTGIVSQPSRASGRGQKLTQTAISQFAKQNQIPLLTPAKPDEQTADWIRSSGCDLILVMAYGHILRRNILDLPSLGIFNFHASILPKYRGASPIETAIACGETETGVSLMEVVEEMDAGDMADVEKIPITSGSTYSEIAEKIAAACPILLQRNLGEICNGTLKLEKQNPADATFTKKLSKIDGMLDFSKPAVALVNRVRALTPHIGCHVIHRETLLKVGKVSADFSDYSEFKPGEIIAVDRNFVKIATGEGALLIHELQRPGKKMLQIKDFTNGFAMNPGEIIAAHPQEQLVFSRPRSQRQK
ncbi:MAG: methionyl-tRNA formyltransferase [Puniceicoccales bacterium]|jgi:methionyl-tRNA formyltransferase|nr:methionyl-tRNA formyltransferase [Puniceicoccales bacterium]